MRLGATLFSAPRGNGCGGKPIRVDTGVGVVCVVLPTASVPGACAAWPSGLVLRPRGIEAGMEALDASIG
mgnify:CR=1 FL=1